MSRLSISPSAQEKEKQLQELARDYDAQAVRVTEMLIDVSALGFLTADAGGALRLTRYDHSVEHQRATLRGKRLLNL